MLRRCGMRKARLFILLTLVVLFTLAAMIRPAQGVRATGAPFGHERYYTVYYLYGTCIIGPESTLPVGEWYVDCDGHWYGYGWKPGEYPDCTYYELVFGDPCDLE